jgi:dihydroorotase-like cyclic amidohydrolase
MVLQNAASGATLSQRLAQYIQSLAKMTPFVGERLKYRVMKTFPRGEEVYDAETRMFTHDPVRQLPLT